MKQEINYSRYIFRYLEGVMNKEEKIWFEKELEGNHELQKELELHKKISSAISDHESISLKNQLEVIHNAIYERKPRRIIFDTTLSAKKYFLTGIAAAFIIITFLVIRNAAVNNSAEELYAEFFKPADINMNFRSASEAINGDLKTAMLLYEDQKYEDAIVLFEKVLSSDESRIGLNLYSGISHMEINQYNDANVKFKKIIDQNTNAFVESAEWYMGLCYLRMKENTKARMVFENIVQSNSYYKKDAKRIINKLN